MKVIQKYVLLYTQSKGDKSNKTRSLSHHIYHINFEFTEI
jgi:hypothetical protein